jgi:hypothetical protein
MIRSNGEAAIAQELESIVDNYKRTTQLVSDLHWGGKQASSQTWQLHALASIFNVIIDYTSVTNRKIWRKRYYPNTASILCPVLALYGDAWLQGRASLSQRKEYSLAENLLPGVKEMYATRMQSIKRVNISEMMSFRPIAEKLERRFEACGKDIEANREKVDDIVLSLYDLAVSQVSIIRLIDIRTKCAFMNCGKMANHYFQCNHGVCQECVIIRQQQNTLYCDQCRSENQPVARLFPPLTPQEQAATPPPPMLSTCSRCQVSLSPAKWPIPEELHQNVYQLDCCDTLCSRCLEKCVREGYDVCPTCQCSVDMHEKEVLKTTVQCDGCCLWKSLIREFLAVNCQDHRLCIQCVSQLKHTTTCRTCNRQFSSEEQSLLKQLSALTCTKCEAPVLREQLNENPQCECVLCSKCLKLAQCNSTDLMTCPECNGVQSGKGALLQSYKNVLLNASNGDYEEFNSYLDAAEQHNRNFPICKICLAPMLSQLSKVYAGRCLHSFHDFCLTPAIESAIRTIITNVPFKPVKCPMNGCMEELSSVYLTGSRSLIEEGMYDKYNTYTALQDYKEFICGNCGHVDHVEKEQKHFPCVKCHIDQCLTCHGPWEANHNEKACEFYHIEKLIIERFPASPADCPMCEGTGLDPVQDQAKPEPCSNCTYSQCPGCKLPYLKNKACDHVKCMNPGCNVEFCFPCASLRVPITEHCNSWHRRQCPNFPAKETPAQTTKFVSETRASDKCPECKRLGRRCDPPADLARIRRFALAEY